MYKFNRLLILERRKIEYMATQPVNYLKNVTKSIMYSAVDYSAEFAPEMHDFLDTNKDALVSTYAALRNPKATLKKATEAFQSSKVYKALDYGIKNTFEDLKTGKFYNKERNERDEARLAGMNLDDWDDLSEFNIDEDGSSKKSSNAASEITAGDRKVAGTIESTTASSTAAIVNATISSTEASIKTSKINTAMLYNQNERLFGTLNSSVGVVGNTVNQIMQMQAQAFGNIDKNLSAFFTEQSKLNQERNALLKQLVDFQSRSFTSAADKEKAEREKTLGKKKKKFRWSDINTSGTPDLGRYFEAIQSNIAKEIESLGIPGFSEDGNMLAAMFTSPLRGVSDYIVKGLLPATVKEMTQELSSTVSGLFGNIIAELANNKDKDNILSLVARIFGINTGVNKTIDMSKYEKGPVPFDGLTRKTIIDVIPTYLRHIDSALTGRPEVMFDYGSGRWIKSKDVEKRYKDIHKNAVSSAASEMRSNTAEARKMVKFSDKSQKESFDKAWEQFEEFMYKVLYRFDVNASAEKNGVSPAEFPDLYRHYDLIRGIYKNSAIYREAGGKQRTRYSRYVTGTNRALRARDEEERQYRNIENSNFDVIKQIMAEGGFGEVDKHGKWKKREGSKEYKFHAFSNIADFKDEFGNTLYTYVRNINKELIWQRENWLAGGGVYSGKKGKKGKAPKLTDYNHIQLGHMQNNLINGSNGSMAAAAQSEASKGNGVLYNDLMDAIANAAEDQNIEMTSEAMGALAEMIINANTDEYNRNVKAHIKQSELSQIMNKYVYGQEAVTEDDLKNALKAKEKEDEEEEQEGKKGFLAGVKSALEKYGSFSAAIGGASIEAFRNVLYSADKAIYEMMYKSDLKDDDDKDKYNGFMEFLVGRTSKMFKGVSDKFMEDVIKPFKDKLGIGEDFGDRFKQSMSDKLSWMANTFLNANIETYKPMVDRVMPNVRNLQERILAPERLANRAAALGYKKGSAGWTRSADKYQEKSSNAKYRRKVIRAMYGGDADYNYAQMKNKSEDEIVNMMLAAGMDQERIYRIRGNVDDIYSKDEITNIMLNAGMDQAQIGSILANVNNARKDDIADMMRSAGVSEDRIKEVLKNTSSSNRKNALLKAYYRHEQQTHAKGTFGLPFSGDTMLSKGELLFNEDGMGMVNRTGAYRINKPTHILNSPQSHDLLSSMGVSGLGRRSTIKEDIANENALKGKLFDGIANNADGSVVISGSGTFDTNKMVEEAKKQLPETLSGGVLGAIASTLLGVAGGPLLGLLFGGATSLVAGSADLKTMLFGKEIGQNGERDNSGFISKTVVDAVKKYVPDMAKYGLAGIIPGLLTPLGPIGGLLVGSTIGMLKNNEAFTNKYFGEQGKLTIKSREKKILEKYAPRALKGAALGAAVGLIFGGPFGIMGNAAIGGALNMMGGTEEFKNLLLGTEINGERVGGVLGAVTEALQPIADAGLEFKDKLMNAIDNGIIDPMQRFLQPAINAIPQIAGWLPRKLGKMIEDYYGASLGEITKRFLSPVTNVGGALIKGASKLLMPATLPFRMLGKAGDAIRGKQIETMNADYMTAAERINWLESHGKADKVTDFDRMLASSTDTGSLELMKALRTNINTYRDDYTKIQGQEKSKFKEIRGIIEGYKTAEGKGINAKTQAQIRDAITRGDIDAIPELLRNSGLSEEEFKNLFSKQGAGLEDMLVDYKDLRTRYNNVKGVSKEAKTKGLKEAQEYFKKMGVDVDLTDSHQAQKMLNYLDTEITNREADPLNLKNIAINQESVDVLKDIKAILLRLTGYSGENASDYTNETIRATREVARDEIKGAVADTSEDYEKFTQSRFRRIFGRKPTEEDFEAVDSEAAQNLSRKSGTALGRAWNDYKAKVNKASITDLNTAVGNTKKLNKNLGIKKLLKGKIDDKALKYYSNLSATDRKNINKKLDNKFFKLFLINPKTKPLSEEDLKTINSLGNREFNVEFIHRLNKVRQLDMISKWPTITAVSNIDEGTLANMGYIKGDNNANSANDIIENVENSTDIQPVTEDIETVSGDVVPADTDVSTHGIGTFLLGAGKAALGVGKFLGKAALGTGKAVLGAGKAIGSGIGKAAMAAGNGLLTTGAVAGEALADQAKRIGEGIVQTTEGPAKITNKPDGSVEYDDTDPKTRIIKSIIDKKAVLTEKLQQAQLKAAEVINNINDESKEGSPRKMSVLSMLLAGGILYKTGILGKLYENIIKPVWGNVIKPWWENSAVPFIKNLINDIGNWFINDAFPALVNMAIPLLGEAIAVAIKGSLQIPKMWANAVDAATVGTTRKNAVERGLITAEQAEAAGGTSIGETSYGRVAGKMANATLHAFAAGKAGVAVNALGKVASWGAKHGGIIQRITGAGTLGVTKPIQAAGKAGASFTESIVANSLKRTFLNSTDDTVKMVAGNALANAGKSAINAADDVAKSGIGAKIMGKLTGLAKKGIDVLLGSPRVQSVLAQLSASGIGKSVINLKNKLVNLFDDAIIKGCKTAGNETLKKVASKLNLILTIGMVVIDFATGMDQAEAILGIKDPNLIETFVAGICNALCNLLILPAIIPGIPWIAQNLLKFFGDDLSERQKEADAEYEAYVKETGDNISKDTYMKEQHSVTGKIGRFFRKDIGNTFKAAGDTIGKGAKGAVNYLTGNNKNNKGEEQENTTLLQGIQNIPNALKDLGDIIAKGDFKALFEFRILDTTSPAAIPVNVATTMMLKPMLAIPTAIGFIMDHFKTISEPIKNVGKTVLKQAPDVLKAAFTGDFDTFFKPVEVGDDDKKNPILGMVANGIIDVERFLLFTPMMVTGGIKKIIDSVVSTVNSVKNSFTDAVSDTEKAINGDIKIFSAEYWAPYQGQNGFDSLVGNITNYAYKILTLPQTIISKAIHMVVGDGSPLVAFASKVAEFLGIDTKKAEEKSKENNNGNNESSKEDDKLKNAKDTLDNAEKSVAKASDLTSNKNTTSTTSSAALTTTNVSNSTNVTDPFAEFNNNDRGSNLMNMVGQGKYGRGKYSKQIDPSISGYRFNTNRDSQYQTVGDSACGPIAAVNAIESFGRGKAALDASRFALKGNYKETNGGTRPEFFRDYFASKGFGSAMNTNKDYIARNIASGNPTVLMGSDARGVSSRTPYGKYPHYVTVTGTDGRGNAIVQDPESRYDNQLYPMGSLLSKSKFGITAFNGRGSFGYQRVNFGRGFKFGRGGNVEFSKDGYITKGQVIEIPAGLGKVHTYMGWQLIKSKSSNQYKLRATAGENYNTEGFAVINGRYVIACTTTYGNVGDYVDWYKEDGTIIPSIIGDIKSRGDAGCNEWGHQNGNCIVEFVVDKYQWYKSATGVAHANPGTDGCHPEWKGKSIVKAVNGGSYYDNPMIPAPTGQNAPATISNTTLLDRAGVTENFKSEFDTGEDTLIKKAENYEMEQPGTNGENQLSEQKTDVSGGIIGAFTAAFKASKLGQLVDLVFNGGNKNNADIDDESTSGEEQYEDPAATSEGKNNLSDAYAGSRSSAVGTDEAHDYPYFNQADPRWGSKMYKYKTMKESGCGPTSMAMVLRGYGNDVDPMMMADWSVAHGYRIKDAGTAHGFFPAIASEYGLQTQQVSADMVPNLTASGYPVIASMGPGDFTKGGHFLVIPPKGVENDNMVVNDPGSIDRTTRNWNFDKSIAQAKKLWVFEGELVDWKKKLGGAITEGAKEAEPTAAQKYNSQYKISTEGDDFFDESEIARQKADYYAQKEAMATEDPFFDESEIIAQKNAVAEQRQAIVEEDPFAEWGSGNKDSKYKPASMYGTYMNNLRSGTGNVRSISSTHKPKYGRAAMAANSSASYTAREMDIIIKALMTIADNTDKLNIIVSILNKRLGTSITADEFAEASTNTNTKQQLINQLNTSGFNKFTNAFDQISDSPLESIMREANRIASE